MTPFMDLDAALPLLLPKAIAWAESEANIVAGTGQALGDAAQTLARRVGVSRPREIRVALVDALPMPQDPMLQIAAVEAGLLSPHMKGLTLGHSIFICHGHDSWRLLSHEFRHVYQYEQAGSIAAFLRIYLPQIVQSGYANAPLEADARANETDHP